MALNPTSSTTSLDAKHKRFEDDLLTWLERHGCHVRDKVAFDQACRSQCATMLDNLRKEDNPEAVMAYLLNSSSLLDTVQATNPTNTSTISTANASFSASASSGQQQQHHVIGNIVSPRQVGRLANHMIREELARDRRKAALSPALILTQRKRADILSRLMNGVSLVEDEQDVFQTIHSSSPSRLLPSSSSQQQLRKKHQLTGMSSVLSSNAPQQQSMTKNDLYMLGNTPSFTPKWDHYNTMRSRWKYLQPQTRHLVEEESVLAPASSTSYLKLGQVQLGGSYVDIQHFQSTVKAQNSKSLSIAAKSMMLEQERQRVGTKR